MITITRRLARQLRAVFRRALNLSSRRAGPAIIFGTGPDGIRARARSADAAVEYHAPGELTEEHMWVPYGVLSDVEARRDDPVQLEALGNGRIVARWRDGSVPQMVQHDRVIPPEVDDFPNMPISFAESPPGLLAALHDAMQTTDPDAARYATDHIQLRGGSESIAATDGRQMLIQSGFEFPWKEALLIPRTSVFGSKEFPKEEPVSIGRTDGWVAVRVGPWTVSLRIEKEKRFPEVDSHVPRIEAATASFRVSPADAEFLANNLSRLPGDDEFNGPITVDLNGSVAIRARSASQPHPTELALAGSTLSGEPIRISTDRRFLARSVKLGFDEMYLYSPNAPVMCRDSHRQYVWALLSPDSAISPAANVARITAPEAGKSAPATNHKSRNRKATMSRSPTTNEDGRAMANRRKHSTTDGKTHDPGIEALITQVEGVRVSLRESLSKTGELISAMKRHRKQSKLVACTLESLRRLQAVDA